MSRFLQLAIAVSLLALPARGLAAGLILNEYNAVASNEFLNGNSAPDNIKDNADSFFGRIEGNGGNWLELVVVEDHLDVRGWQLRWLENDGEANGNLNDPAIWDPTRVNGLVSQGVLTFNPSASIWSDLRSGTIITVSEQFSVDEIVEAANPVNDPVDTGFNFDLSTDASYDPAGGDWRIHVSTRDEVNAAVPLITTLTNVDGDSAGDFSIGPADWEIRVFNGAADVFGPIGEAIEFGNPPDTFGGVNDEEIVRLEVDPSSMVTIADYDDEDRSTFGEPNVLAGGATVQDFSVLRSVIGGDVDGDTNGDGLVNIDDLNSVRNNFGTSGLPDGTLDGDAFPFDGMVDIDDLNSVRNNFGAGAATVPEPGAAVLAAIGLINASLYVRRVSASSDLRSPPPAHGR